MSNINEIFFDLLILVTMSQYGLSQTLIAPMAELSEVTNRAGPISYTASLFQHGAQNRFFIYDPDADTVTLSSRLKDEFSSNAIEFYAYRGLGFEFLYRRSPTEIIWLRCSMAHERFVYSFYNSIYNFQNGGLSTTHISKIARYENETRILQPFDETVILYVKDIGGFSNGAIAKTYTISRYNTAKGRTEPVLIFRSGAFAISEVHGNKHIALCLKDFPNERFLIAFSGQKACETLVQDHMQANMHAPGARCEFPNISVRVALTYLGV